MLHPRNGDTQAWVESITAYPIGATSRIEVFLADVQAMVFLLQWSVVIEANVDARTIARKIAQNLEERALLPEHFWFESAIKNRDFYADTAAYLVDPPVKAFELEELERRLRKVDAWLRAEDWRVYKPTKKQEPAKSELEKRPDNAGPSLDLG